MLAFVAIGVAMAVGGNDAGFTMLFVVVVDVGVGIANDMVVFKGVFVIDDVVVIDVVVVVVVVELVDFAVTIDSFLMISGSDVRGVGVWVGVLFDGEAGG